MHVIKCSFTCRHQFTTPRTCLDLNRLTPTEYYSYYSLANSTSHTLTPTSHTYSYLTHTHSYLTHLLLHHIHAPITHTHTHSYLTYAPTTHTHSYITHTPLSHTPTLTPTSHTHTHAYTSPTLPGIQLDCPSVVYERYCNEKTYDAHLEKMYCV